jgi:hypothetical protein
MEFKPITKKQEEDLFAVRQMILAEEGAQTSEKFGAPLEGKDGTKTWINRDSEGNWWIEVDEGATFSLPDTLKVLGIDKSAVKI